VFTHDIGYVRGVLSGDTRTEFVIDKTGKTVSLPRGASDAALAPYHVDRSKIFVFERLAKPPAIDAKRVANAIEATRFPPLRIAMALTRIWSPDSCKLPILSVS